MIGILRNGDRHGPKNAFGGYEPFVAPMALTLAWGLTFAMPMTVFLIPAAYVTLDSWNTAIKARLGRLFRMNRAH